MSIFSSPNFQSVNYANVPAHDPSGKLGLQYRQKYLDSLMIHPVLFVMVVCSSYLRSSLYFFP